MMSPGHAAAGNHPLMSPVSCRSGAGVPGLPGDPSDKSSHTLPLGAVVPVQVFGDSAAAVQPTVPAPLLPVAHSRRLWHLMIKSRLAHCKDFFDIGELLFTALQTFPARVSMFLRTYNSFAMPFRGGSLDEGDSRLRDLLPLPLPSMEKYSRWRESSQSRTAGGSYNKKKRSRDAFNRRKQDVCLEIWNYLVVFGLNYEYCGRLNQRHWKHNGSPKEGQARCLANISSAVSYFVGPMPVLSMPDYFGVIRSKSLDYSGNESCLAVPLRLAELIPGLPPAELAASVDATSLCSTELGDWLRDPHAHLLPKNEWPVEVPKARVQVESDAEHHSIIHHLFTIGVVDVIADDDIFTVDGTKVLNGMFAVPKKGEIPPGVDKITRLIMNLVPGNSYQRLLTDSLGTLSPAASWTSIHVPESYVLLWSSDDIKGAFYIFRLPRAWRPFMAFEKQVPGHILGPQHAHSEMVYICSAVIPMGWINAVSLFQHLMRNLTFCDEPMGAAIPGDIEWRRDSPLPSAYAWVQCYLDDFDAPCIVPAKDAELHANLLSAALILRRLANARQGVAISESKAVLGALRTERMGALVDGERGRVGVSSERLFDICGFGLFLLSQLVVNCKGLAMFLGRVVHAFEFRRPLFSCLNDVWKYHTGRLILFSLWMQLQKS